MVLHNWVRRELLHGHYVHAQWVGYGDEFDAGGNDGYRNGDGDYVSDGDEHGSGARQSECYGVAISERKCEYVCEAGYGFFE